MRRLTAFAAAPILLIGLAACSSTIEVPVPAVPTIGSAAPAAERKVDAYCKKVQSLVDKANQLQSNPDAALSQEVSKQAQELAAEAVDLVGAAASNPALAARVSQCSADAAAAAGGG